MKYLLADDSIPFDGETLSQRPIGGAEAAFIHLAETLAKRGHQVLVRNRCGAPMIKNGVDWAPLNDAWPQDVDVYVANRKSHLIRRLPHVKKRLFWIHNPAAHLRKPRFLLPLWRFRPTLVFSGPYQQSTSPWFLGCPKTIIPYGLDNTLLHATKKGPPPPKAIFTSNPQRSLDWVLDVWATYIYPQVPEAEYHIYAGAAVYGATGKKADEITRHIEQAKSMKNKGVIVHGPAKKKDLMQALQTARVMLYRGDAGETFCYALAEAQALGVPCVIQNIGSCGERVVHGCTGFIGQDKKDFGQKAVQLLTDDTLWQQCHQASLKTQRQWTWEKAATEIENLVKNL